MGTTPLFVEQIVIGVQGVLWIGLIVAAFLDRDVLAAWTPHLKDWAFLVTVVVLSTIYTLGLILERIFSALAVLLNLRQRVSRIAFPLSLKCRAHSDGLMKLYERTEMLTPYFQYVIVRTRISLATCFNVPLITLGLLLHIRTMSFGLVAFVFLVGAIATVVSILTYASLVETLEVRARQVVGNTDLTLQG